MIHVQVAKISNQRRLLKLRLKVYLLGIAFIALAFGGVYFFRESEVFKITEIKIQGLENSSEEKFLSSLKPIIYQSPIARFLGEENFLSWPNKISLPYPENLKIMRLTVDKNIFKRSIALSVEKRQKFGIWCRVIRPNFELIQTNETLILDDNSVGLAGDLSGARECWWFDGEDGILFEEAPNSEGQLFLKISEESAETRGLGQRVLPDYLFANLKSILNAIAAMNLRVKDLKLDQKVQELAVVTFDGAKMVFSLRFSPANNLAALSEILSATPLEAVDYVDLTVENKVYLKNR